MRRAEILEVLETGPIRIGQIGVGVFRLVEVDRSDFTPFELSQLARNSSRSGDKLLDRATDRRIKKIHEAQRRKEA